MPSFLISTASPSLSLPVLITVNCFSPERVPWSASSNLTVKLLWSSSGMPSRLKSSFQIGFTVMEVPVIV